MKKITILILITALLASLLCACAKTELQTPAGMKLASVTATDYYLYVPSDWTVTSQDGITSAYVSVIDDSNVSCARYALTNPAVFTVTTGEETDKKAEVIYAENFWTDYVSQLQTVLPGFKMLSGPSPAVLDKHAAIRCGYTATLSGTVYVFDMIICIKDQTYAYILTFTSDEDHHEADVAYFDKIADEFVFQTGLFE